jgi:hypothetical protein
VLYFPSLLRSRTPQIYLPPPGLAPPPPPAVAPPPAAPGMATAASPPAPGDVSDEISSARGSSSFASIRSNFWTKKMKCLKHVFYRTEYGRCVTVCVCVCVCVCVQVTQHNPLILIPTTYQMAFSTQGDDLIKMRVIDMGIHLQQDSSTRGKASTTNRTYCSIISQRTGAEGVNERGRTHSEHSLEDILHDRAKGLRKWSVDRRRENGVVVYLCTV